MALVAGYIIRSMKKKYISAVITNNASSNIVGAIWKNSWGHIPCFAHVQYRYSAWSDIFENFHDQNQKYS